ncbi:hypothetical protein [Mucilaginibacter sp.]|uniref:hypothetical protein n=1 Tax=Mucilaginibacter sp. TaxID=1882438 RepID=UPI0025F71D17|nr:hypothetical protein [Mucilaginibacter sp.]
MKKAILLLLVAVAFCSSCKKDQKKGPATPPKTYKVNFNVSDFTQILVGQSTNTPHTDGLKTNTTPPLSSYIDVLYYYVINSNNTLVRSLEQLSDASNFGTIADELPAGSYTIIFAAGKTGLNAGAFETLDQAYLKGYGTGTPALPWKDTFFKKFTITVTAAGVNQSVSLDRIVSQLTLNIEDAIPANAHSIEITARTYLEYSFLTAGPYPTPPTDNFVSTFIIPASAIGTTNYKVSLITLNTTDPSSVKIVCKDASGNILASTIVNNVIMHPNTQTILSGQLFATNSQFNLTANAKWDPATINISF